MTYKTEYQLYIQIFQNTVDNIYLMNNCSRKRKGQSRMDNPEKMATLGTQETG